MNCGRLCRPTGVVRGDIGARVVLTRGGRVLATWPLPGRNCADLAVVDALARLQLGARRLGGRIQVEGASAELWGLLELVGLGGVVTAVGHPPLEVLGQPEDGEEVGVEEVVVADDPVA
jgi:hypothetical protein